MTVLKGKVTNVAFYDQEEDEHGNVVKPVLTVDGKHRVYLLSRKDEVVNGVASMTGKKANYAPIKTGTVVEIDAEKKESKDGKIYYKSQASKIKIKSGAGEFTDSTKVRYKNSNNFKSNSSSNSYNPLGAAAGHAVTNAVNILLNQGGKVTDKLLTEHALMVAKVTHSVMGQLQDVYDGKTEEVAKPKATKKKSDYPEPEEDSDSSYESADEQDEDSEVDDEETGF